MLNDVVCLPRVKLSQDLCRKLHIADLETSLLFQLDAVFTTLKCKLVVDTYHANCDTSIRRHQVLVLLIHLL